MSYHRQYTFNPSLAGLGATALGFADPRYADLGLMDADLLKPTAAMCGGAKIIQQALKDQGKYAGKIDGIFGSGTQAGYKAVTGAVWPDPTSCNKLFNAQVDLILKAYAAAHPEPPPDQTQPGTGDNYVPVVTGTEVPPVKPVAGGGVTKSTTTGGTTTTAAPPAADEPWYVAHWQWLALGGVVLVLGGVMAFAASGDSAPTPAAELKANRRRSRRRHSRRH